MGKRELISCILACMLFTLFVKVETLKAQGDSPLNPAPIGTTVVASVELGNMYGASELYDVKIVIQEIVSGKEVMERIKAMSGSNQKTKVGFVYILAHIRFEFYARGAPGDKNYDLKEDQFIAVSSDGKIYGSPFISQNNLTLRGILQSGDSLEGWLAFQVPQDDSKPLLFFERGSIWFQLY